MPTYSTIQKNLKAVCMLLLATTIIGEASLANRAGGRGKGGGKRFSPKNNSVYGKPKNESDRRRVIEGKEWGTSSRVSSFNKEKIRKPLQQFIGKESTTDTETNPYEITPPSTPSTPKERRQAAYAGNVRKISVSEETLNKYNYAEAMIPVLAHSEEVKYSGRKFRELRTPEAMVFYEFAKHYSNNALNQMSARFPAHLEIYLKLYPNIQRSRHLLTKEKELFLSIIRSWENFEKKSVPEFLKNLKNYAQEFLSKYVHGRAYGKSHNSDLYENNYSMGRGHNEGGGKVQFEVFKMAFDNIFVMNRKNRKGKIQALEHLISQFDLLSSISGKALEGYEITPKMEFDQVLNLIQYRHAIQHVGASDFVTGYITRQMQFYTFSQIQLIIIQSKLNGKKEWADSYLKESNKDNIEKEIEFWRQKINNLRELLTSRLTQLKEIDKKIEEERSSRR